MPFYHLNLKTPLRPPYHVQDGSHLGNVYYHYTNEKGRQGIRSINAITASEKNSLGQPKGLCRTYFTDIPPALIRQDRFNNAVKIFGKASFNSWESKLSYCFVINLSGIENIIIKAAPHIYYVENTPFLPLKYNIHGQSVNRIIFCENVLMGRAIS